MPASSGRLAEEIRVVTLPAGFFSAEKRQDVDDELDVGRISGQCRLMGTTRRYCIVYFSTYRKNV
ncbi:hypothetical protein BDZ97DRAFT_1851655, partial [Flammula alnicola]